MSIIRQKPAIEVEERTHCVQILTPKGLPPSLEILREEVDTTTAVSTNLGLKKAMTWAALAGTPQFAAFMTTLGLTNPAVFFGGLRDLFDNLCDPNYGVPPPPAPEPEPE